jgi:hypothetical protein
LGRDGNPKESEISASSVVCIPSPDYDVEDVCILERTGSRLQRGCTRDFVL